MIFTALYELYQRLEGDPHYEIAPPRRSYQKVSFVVVLNPEGSLFEIQDARQPQGKKLVPRRVLVLGSTKPSGSGKNPCFLWDSPAYLLGWDPGKPARAKEVYEAFRTKHLALEKEINVPAYSAVCRFLEKWQPEWASQFPILEDVGTGFGVFQIRGEMRFVHETPEIIEFVDKHPEVVEWELEQEDSPGPSKPTVTGQCLITGDFGPIARLHPKVKGVANAQPSGATIAGFNDPAYWSYGLEQSFNSPVSKEAAHRYITALNALLEGPRREKHRLVVGNTTVAFWTERPTATEDVFVVFAAEGSDAFASELAQDEGVRAKLEAFLKALRQGRQAYAELEENPEGTGYFILGLAAPTPARIAVRFFHRGTLAELLANLRRHYEHTAIERRFGDSAKRPDPEFPSVRLLLRETAREEQDIPPLLPGKLLEAIVTGARYPEGLFSAVMRRIAGDRVINYARACVLRGYLVRNLRKEVPMSLDTTRPDPAYRLGRLFAALEKTQQDALGGINSTIRDRFYASASATPATVFPRLLRTYQHHLAALEPGFRINREKLVQEILAPLNEIPAYLNLAEQALFALGYYHQINAFFTRRAEQSETAGV